MKMQRLARFGYCFCGVDALDYGGLITSVELGGDFQRGDVLRSETVLFQQVHRKAYLGRQRAQCRALEKVSVGTLYGVAFLADNLVVDAGSAFVTGIERRLCSGNQAT